MLRLIYLVVGLLPATVFSQNVTSPNEFTIGMKTLVLFEQGYDQTVPRLVLDGYGTLYDIQHKLPDLTTPDYYAIVISHPALSDIDLRTLRNYADKYNVRMVFLNSDLQLDGICSDDESYVFQNVVFDASDSSLEIADVMNANGYWNVAAPAQQAITIDEYDNDRVTPFMRYTNNTHRESEGPVAAFTYRYPNGREEMHFTFSAVANELCNACTGVLKDQPNFIQTGDYTHLSLALGQVWFQWVTKQIYFGDRRIHAHVQVDDWFIASSVYGQPGKIFRINGTDVDHTVAFVQGLPKKLNLAPGSFIKYEPAFNGAGNTGFQLQQGRPGFFAERLGVGMNEATNKHIGDFHWISHTWSHQQLDWLNADQCGGRSNTCPTSNERVRVEIKANRMIALGEYVNATQMDPIGLASEVPTPAGQMFFNKPDLAQLSYSPSCMVTPEISGLYPRNYNISLWNGEGGYPRPGNFELMKTLYSVGIRAVVGDNSRPELVSPVSFHHAVITSVKEYGVKGITIIPRMAVNIAYNANNEEIFLDWYNGLGACNYSVGVKCREKGQNYTFEEALHRQIVLVTGTWLVLREDPYMFHQANLHHFKRADGSLTSLLTYWTEHAIRHFTRYITGMPITSPKMDVTAQRYLQRTARDMAGINATMTIKDNKPTAIKVTSSDDCVALLSLGTKATYTPTMAQSSVFEVSGNDTTYQIQLLGNGQTENIFFTSQGNKTVGSV